MNNINLFDTDVSRRAFLGRAGIGTMGLASLLNPALMQAERPQIDKWTGVLKELHHKPKVKRVIHLCMAGGASHLETFDYKPKLRELDGKPMPKSVTKGQPIAQLQGKRNQLKCLGPQHEFKKFGKSGQHICGLFPEIGSVADDIAIVRSMTTDAINHDPAHTLMNTGTTIAGRPSMGSWSLYGLGAETENLPGYVVLISAGGGQDQPVAARQWHAGFLPSRFQGVQLRSKGDPVLYVNRPGGVDANRQRDVVDAVQSINQLQGAAVRDPEIATRIAQYEMAFRMQSSVPELMDISKEPKEVLEMYGAKPGDGSFASNCLLARRLAERGVRFIQLYHRGWDHHGNIKGGMQTTSRFVDRGCAALIKDLKRAGLFEDTLILWGGEFGRTPMAQGSGRDHHIKGFSIWFAGGGIKGGTSYGATDEFGYNAVENVIDVNDLHATILHLMGIDHTRLTYRFQGADFRLTNFHGKVLKDILA
ncbi:MAG: DUF1501 domain-containing protein [Verrucomicrobiota bacterium]|jgi:hypothetical protein|nr:DUF1501 domain-containing protein [Verrucomicrobiota bacterium]